MANRALLFFPQDVIIEGPAPAQSQQTSPFTLPTSYCQMMSEDIATENQENLAPAIPAENQGSLGKSGASEKRTTERNSGCSSTTSYSPAAAFQRSAPSHTSPEGSTRQPTPPAAA